MKRSLVIAAVIIISFAPIPAAFCEDLPTMKSLTLKDAITTAMISNKSVQIQEEEISYAKGNILYAKSLFLPQVNAGFSYQHNETVFDSKAAANHRKDTRIYQGYVDQNEFQVTAEESIFNGGANIANLAQARLNLRSQLETLRATRLDIEFETKRLFYGLLLGYETRRIARDLVEQAKAHYIETEQMYNQGTASKFDLLQSKVQVSRLMPQLVNAETAIDLLMAEFKKVLSISMKDRVEVSGELAYSLIDIKEDDFLSEAYKKNPQMVVKLLGIDINRWAIEYAKAGWYPNVSAIAGYTVMSNNIGNMFNPRHDNWNAGVSVSMAIFDGFATKAKVDEAKARYQQSYLEKENLSDQIAVDIKSACIDLERSRTIIMAEKDSIVEAKEALRLAEVRFRNGVGINLDIFDAQVALAQVEQALAQGIYDYLMATAQLNRTMGREYSIEERL